MKQIVSEIRNQFPILSRSVNGKPLVYFDNAATTQRPVSVIEAGSKYYRELNANVHRGVHYLSTQSTIAFEEARKSVAQFINASSDSEIIFTRGTTESINLGAEYGFANMFYLRGGYENLYERDHQNGVTFGGGVEYLRRGMMGFRVRVNVHGEVLAVEQPGMIDPNVFQALEVLDQAGQEIAALVDELDDYARLFELAGGPTTLDRGANSHDFIWIHALVRRFAERFDTRSWEARCGSCGPTCSGSCCWRPR